MIPDKETLQKYIDDNIPQWKIGEYFGTHQSTVSSWFKKYGLKSKIKTGGAHNIKDLVGKRFGKLQVISYINTDRYGKNYLCRCDCGNTTCQVYADLKSGKVKSCGYYGKEIASINGSTIGMNNYINVYGGYFIKANKKIRCRSGYEVIYANWLIKNNIDFEYEPKCFVLDNTKRYTPDFHLSETDEWVEIKGSFKVGNSHQKDNINIFKTNHNHKILFWNDIVYVCNLPYKSYSTYFRHADKKHINREDYLAKSLYDE